LFNLISLIAKVYVFSERTPLNFINPTNMSTTLPPPKFDHKKGFKIEIEHKNAIRELYSFREKLIKQLIERYKLGKLIIHRVLRYDTTKRACLTRTRRPLKLSDARINEVIKYCFKKWENRILDYNAMIRELGLECTTSTL
jgi:hypothetical protein